MRSRLACTHGECRIEEEHPLRRPFFQITVMWNRHIQIGMELFKNIHEGCRRGDSLRNRKTQAMGLSVPMIGILAEDDHLYGIEWCAFKRRKYARHRRIDDF